MKTLLQDLRYGWRVLLEVARFYHRSRPHARPWESARTPPSPRSCTACSFAPSHSRSPTASSNCPKSYRDNPMKWISPQGATASPRLLSVVRTHRRLHPGRLQSLHRNSSGACERPSCLFGVFERSRRSSSSRARFPRGRRSRRRPARCSHQSQPLGAPVRLRSRKTRPERFS